MTPDVRRNEETAECETLDHPTSILKKIQQSTAIRDGVEACKDLQGWLRAGGSQPVWTAFIRGTAAFIRWRKRQGIKNPPVPAAESTATNDAKTVR